MIIYMASCSMAFSWGLHNILARKEPTKVKDIALLSLGSLIYPLVLLYIAIAFSTEPNNSEK